MHIIGAMPADDQALAAAVHTIVAQEAPYLNARTWYGMHAWENADGVVVFLQVASKFDARYSTLGFEDSAQLDGGICGRRVTRCNRLTTPPKAASAT